VRRRGSYGRRVADDFCERCGDLLTGSNDCVDRVVLNAYFPLGHNPGGCWDYPAGIERQAPRRRLNDALRLLSLPWLHPTMERGGCAG
jgi:hypothetical protein